MGECDHPANDFPVPFAQRPIIILGAGIIGCAAARQLLLKGFDVTLVAEFLPGDQDIHYASAWAGAAWHAAGGITPDQRYIQAVTHRILRQMALEPESGVSIVDAREYLERTPTPDSALWGKTVVSRFRSLSPGEYPSEFACAWAYETLVTDPTRHMPYLKRQIQRLGGHFIRHKVESLRELYDMFPDSRVFINASGLGSKTLADVRDDRCFPERGQNVFLRTNRCRTMYFRNGQEYTYVIPRPHSGGVVLGGVKQEDNLSPNVDLEIARDEIARAHRLAPDVVPANPPEDAISHIIGIRPSRKGGFRLDSEVQGSRTLLSAYGFGGGGYAFSYGVAEALVRMVERAERDNVIV
ncbi:FAD dependent oxidoreductase superfamily [Penicillium brasilianum]|uniref:FAD dependent oxidoreductase superfamily n=1 Tax=Penicillium brasilianum TaxID=104259 RepID=A0A1S9RRS1_PENBI|nr:FAD dependent oxidoreductase superfamily [Penicillium brasilianum]